MSLDALARQMAVETVWSYPAATRLIESLVNAGVPHEAIEQSSYENLPWLMAAVEARPVSPYRLPMPRRRIPLREVRHRP